MSQSHDIRLDSDGQTAIPRSVRVPLLRGADDIDFITDEVESALREIASRVEGVERSLMRGVTAPVVAKPGEPGIRGTLLLHVTGDGTAFLAVNSRTDRYCTHVVSDVPGAGELQCYGFGHWPVALRPDIDPVGQGPLWLSEVPGMAVDAEPVGAAVVQRIGERTTVRSNVSGVAFCVFKPEFWPAPEGDPGPPGPKGDKGDAGPGVAAGGTTGQVLVKDSDTDFDTVWDDLPSAPVSSVNGQTGAVVLDHEDVGAAAEIHTHTLSDITDAGTAAAANVPASGDASAGEVVLGDDSRLSDDRDPLPHTHAISDVTGLQGALDGKEPSIAGGTINQYWRGDKTWQNLPAPFALEVTDGTTSDPSVQRIRFDGADVDQDGGSGDVVVTVPSAPVSSVNSKTGAVVLDNTDVGAAATSHTHALSDITNAGTAAGYDVPVSGDAGSGEVVLGDDSRLHEQNTDTGTTYSYFQLGQGLMMPDMVGGHVWDYDNGMLGAWNFSNNNLSNFTAAYFYGNGSNITDINADNISTGTVNAARLPASIAYTDDNVSFDGSLYADGPIESDSGFVGDGSNLTGLTKGQVGLGNVDNTADLDKPISTATQSALNGKEGTISAGSTSQYWRGDKTWQTLNKAAVGLGNVDNTSDANKPVSTATQSALNGKANSVHTHAASAITSGEFPAARMQNAYLKSLADYPALAIQAGFIAFEDNGTIHGVRSIEGTPNLITVTNTTGSGGNPTISVGSNVARRDVPNTFAALQSFDGGVRGRVRITSAGTTAIAPGDSFVQINLNVGNITIDLSDPNLPVSYDFWASIVNSHASNQLTFDAGAGNNVHGPSIFNQVWAMNTALNAAHRWFKVVKISATVWSIDTGGAGI